MIRNDDKENSQERRRKKRRETTLSSSDQNDLEIVFLDKFSRRVFKVTMTHVNILSFLLIPFNTFIPGNL